MAALARCLGNPIPVEKGAESSNAVAARSTVVHMGELHWKAGLRCPRSNACTVQGRVLPTQRQLSDRDRWTEKTPAVTRDLLEAFDDPASGNDTLRFREDVKNSYTAGVPNYGIMPSRTLTDRSFGSSFVGAAYAPAMEPTADPGRPSSCRTPRTPRSLAGGTFRPTTVGNFAEQTLLLPSSARGSLLSRSGREVSSKAAAGGVPDECPPANNRERNWSLRRTALMSSLGFGAGFGNASVQRRGSDWHGAITAPLM